MRAINVTALKANLSKYLRMAWQELAALVAALDLAAVDGGVIARAKSPFAVNIRAIDAIHVATAEVLAAEADTEPLGFWTHDQRQADAAVSGGLIVHGIARSS